MEDGLDSLIKEFGIKNELSLDDISDKHDEPHSEEKTIDISWSPDVLPVESNADMDSAVYLAQLEDALTEAETLKKRKRKLVRLLHVLDIELIKQVTAKDLISYDGRTIPQRIAHLINKNTGLLNWISTEMSFSKLIRMMEHAVLLKSFNNLSVFVKAAQSKRLTSRRVKRLSTYKEHLDKMDGGIFPFEWMLKDAAESNINVTSEIAARRFCKIVEKLKEMKQIEPSFAIKERYRLQILSRIWSYLGANSQNRPDGPSMKDEMMYVLL